MAVSAARLELLLSADGADLDVAEEPCCWSLAGLGTRRLGWLPFDLDLLPSVASARNRASQLISLLVPVDCFEPAYVASYLLVQPRC